MRAEPYAPLLPPPPLIQIRIFMGTKHSQKVAAFMLSASRPVQLVSFRVYVRVFKFFKFLRIFSSIYLIKQNCAAGATASNLSYLLMFISVLCYQYILFSSKYNPINIFMRSSCLHRASIVSKHFLLFQMMHTIIKS